MSIFQHLAIFSYESFLPGEFVIKESQNEHDQGADINFSFPGKQFPRCECAVRI